MHIYIKNNNIYVRNMAKLENNIDLAVSATPLSFDSAVSAMPQSFDLEVSLTPLSFNSAVSLTPLSFTLRCQRHRRVLRRFRYVKLSGVADTAEFSLSGVMDDLKGKYLSEFAADWGKIFMCESEA
jgi:hypothetical protein